jgi:hypothetical protein
MRVPFRMIEASRDGTGRLDLNQRTYPLLPEQDLMLAVLEDAIACYMKHLKARRGSARALFEEAERWFFDDSHDWIYSFPNICQMIGLNTNYVRRGLTDAKRTFFGHRPKSKIYRLDGMRHRHRGSPQTVGNRRPAALAGCVNHDS